MVSILHNYPGQRFIRYVGGQQSAITLNPGVNLNVDPSEWEAIARHPIIAGLIQEGVIKVVSEPSTSTLEVTDKDSETRASFEVVDDPNTGQPMPVLEVGEKADVGKMDISTHQAAKVLPALTLINKAEKPDELTPLPSIGKASARQIFENRPEHGYASLDAVEKANSSLTQADWEAIALWEAAE